MSVNPDDNLKIVSLNVRGLANFRKRRSIFNWCRRTKADLILLQETHSSSETEFQWQNEWGGKIYFSHGSHNSRGVAVVCKNGSNIDVKQIHRDNNGRIIIVNFVKNELHFVLTNIYAPNTEIMQTNFYTDLKQIFLDKTFEDNDKIIVGGDYNCVLNANLDKKGGNVKVKESVVKKINEIIDTFELVDIWRRLNPEVRRYTWRQNNPLIQCRLDYFLISDALIENVDKVDIFPGMRTDHSAILINLRLQKEYQRGPGHWKFNNSYLDDDDYVSQLNNELKLWLQDNSIVDDQVKWEWMKFKVRDFTIHYAKAKCKLRKDKLDELTKQLNNLEKELAINATNDLIHEIEIVKQNIQELDAKIIDGVIVRARIRWAEKGEKSNKYFLGLEKRNSRRNQCKKLITEDGTEIVNPNEIAKMQGDYYKNLY